MRYFKPLIAALFAIYLFSCQNKKAEIMMEQVADYYPTQIGKYIIYRVDSLVFTRNGSQIETHKYQIKHTVEAQTSDGLGRTSFRVQRLIRDENGTTPWVNNGNYLVTPLPDRVEITEDNLRSLKLVSPLRSGFTWKGFSHYPLYPYAKLYEMNAGNDMHSWEFTYGHLKDTSVQGQNYKNVWPVWHRQYELNFPVTPETILAVKENSREMYAKNIGLVFKEAEIYEYQRANADNPSPSYTGFGITMWMIEHN